MTQTIQVPQQYLNSAECEALKQNADVNLTWTSFGPNGNEKAETKMLCELYTEHLENILISQPQITPQYKAAILKIIKDRMLDQFL